MPMPLPRLSLLLSALLLASQAQAFQTADPSFKGLPAGGGLDPQKITEGRYGKDAPAVPAADLPGAAAPSTAGVASASASTPASTPAPAPTPMAGALATLWLERTGAASEDRQVPLTFGQTFAPGVLPREARLGLRLADGTRVALQADVKALHGDGSVRHAILSGILPAPGAKPMALGLVRLDKGLDAAAPAVSSAATPAALVQAGLTAGVRLTIDGQQYSAALEQLLARDKPATWLNGPVAYEWHASAPLADRNGQQHPHLAARFAVRWYPALKQARVDVTVENDWAWEPAPQNFTYDAEISVGGKAVYRKAGLEHYHHARWRTLAWWGGAPAVHLRHDGRQLIDSLALPNYDPAVTISERVLADMAAKWEGPKTEPMGVGAALKAMPTTGGRGDIGLQPAWAVNWLLSQDPRARAVTLGTADLGGSWSIHYRDRRTGLPVSLIDYPYMTRVGHPGDTKNPATGKREAFPVCPKDACRTPNQPDISHQPNLAYLPYLLTGDHYYLEELQFWAMHNVFASNPGYRENRKGLLKPEQVRGQAWALRTLAEAAYITPEGHPLKQHFLQILDSNLDWYNAEYSNNPKANALGIIVNGYSVLYREKTGIAPWQDDFFTSAVGRAAELGFARARPLLKWKAKYPVARMVGEGSCPMMAAMYSMRVRDSVDAPFYTTIGEAFRKSYEPNVAGLACGSAEMAAALKVRPGEMAGYGSSTAGYPSNMQPALAYAADATGAVGRKAWDTFMARSVKPDYNSSAQFAIVPRAY